MEFHLSAQFIMRGSKKSHNPSVNCW